MAKDGSIKYYYYMVKIIIMCLSPKVFIRLRVEHLNIHRWKVRYFCVLNFASLHHYFAAKKINNNCILAMS